MDTYSDLIEKISRVPALEKYLQDVERKGFFLNLATADWEERLNNYAVYQDFMHNSTTKYRPPVTSANKIFMTENLKESQKPFKVCFVAHCKRPYAEKGNNEDDNNLTSLVLHNSPPLTKIVQAMTTGATYPIEDICKVRQSLCSYSNCHACKTYFKVCMRNKVKLWKSQPCMLNTKVFNGKDISPRFYSEVAHQLPFIAIVNVVFNCRFSYVNPEKIKVMRIGGVLSKMVTVTESVLENFEEIVKMGDYTFCTPSDSIDIVEDNENIADNISETDPMALIYMPSSSGQKRTLDSAIEEEKENDEDNVDVEEDDDDDDDRDESIVECIPDTFTELKKRRRNEDWEDATLDVEEDRIAMF